MPRPDHVVIVIEENKSESEIIGSADAPFITSMATQGADMTNSYAVTHPSEPNYLALFSGSTQGITDDGCPHSFTVPSLGGELLSAGFAFRGYSEGLPSEGYLGCVSGNYARKHNPWADFVDVPAAMSLPFTDFPTDYSKLPSVSFVTPDLDDDMHNGTVAEGDRWLEQHLGPYIQWAKTHNSLFILTFDENDGSPGNKIPTILIGQHIKPGAYGETINHYSILRTLESAFGLGPLGKSGSAAPITNIWN